MQENSTIKYAQRIINWWRKRIKNCKLIKTTLQLFFQIVVPDNRVLDVWIGQSSESQKTKVPPSSDDYVLDQLCICEEQLLKLMEELEASGKDVEQLAQQMEAEEVSELFRIGIFFS